MNTGTFASAGLIMTALSHEARVPPGPVTLNQLAVVDFLFVRIAQRLYRSSTPELQSTYDAVQPHRLDTGRPRSAG